ncbi:TraR/DksA family transcriptional regulator [Aureliella helgolandensis]|uniref:General stress protein 16O n=1 Tax=Aureliella helgolandensis TaxID=2527968 RepID=A0A518G6A7_9BACT|nr:TraR/DksA family transcriptional regulator [Aureliella helgolandensis]QDV24109.1 General stress protein 16O [Aureliella helgolandensis]
MSRQTAIAKLRAVLFQRRELIRSALRGDLHALRQLKNASGELADVALDSSDEEVSSQRAELESHELDAIDNALSRMNSGKFGNCEGCDKKIPLARLEILPFATLCIACQVKLENSGFADWTELTSSA